jgi:membrane-associated phospholipid phosphatase
LKSFFYQNKIFLSLYLVFLIVGGILIRVYEHGDEIIYINSLHTSFFNQLFRWTTMLAELPSMFLLFLIAFFSSYGKGLLLGLNAVFIFVTVQICKLLIFADQVRPAVFFEGKTNLNFVEGVEIARYNSFPSGHTAIAFAMFFMLSILTKDRRWSYVLFIAALLVAISRVYLLQHFLRDVYFGSLIGVLVPMLFYLSFSPSKFYNNLKWKDKALFR